MKLNQPIAIVAPRRTPFAQIGKALGSYSGHDLGMFVARDILKRTQVPLDQIDGVIVGEAFSSAPNAARVISNLIGLPNRIPAITLANNCVSEWKHSLKPPDGSQLAKVNSFLSWRGISNCNADGDQERSPGQEDCNSRQTQAIASRQSS